MNSTSNSSCVLEEFVVWSPSCPSSLKENYKAISITFAVVYACLLMIHGRNFAVRLVKDNFKVKVSNSIMMIDIALMLICLFSMVMWSNYNGIHHYDGCTAEIAGDLRLSFGFIAL